MGRSEIFEGRIGGERDGVKWELVHKTEVEEEEVAGGGRYAKRKAVTHDFHRLLKKRLTGDIRSPSSSGY